MKSTGGMSLVAPDVRIKESFCCGILPGARTKAPTPSDFEPPIPEIAPFSRGIPLDYWTASEWTGRPPRTTPSIPAGAPCRDTLRRAGRGISGQLARKAGSPEPSSFDFRASNSAPDRLATLRSPAAEGMMNHPTSDPFPCPFCRSRCVSRIGAAGAFLHYRCSECEEVWTAMKAPAPPAARRRLDPAFAPVSKQKTIIH